MIFLLSFFAAILYHPCIQKSKRGAMSVSIRTVIKKTFTYGLFSTISSAIPFLLLPLLTRYLSPEDYGVLALFTIFTMIVPCLFRLEIQVALRREYVENKQDFSDYVGTAIAIISYTFCIFLLSCLFIACLLQGELWQIPSIWYIGILFISFGSALYTFLTSIYQMQHKAMTVGLWDVFITLITLTISVVLIIVFKFNWEGRAWAMLFASLFIQIPASLYFIYKMFPYRFKIQKNKAREMLAFSLPLVPVSVAGYLLQMTDRIFINHMVGLEAVGLYAVAGQLAAVIMMVYNSFLPTWESWVLHSLQKRTSEGNRQVVRFFYFYVLAMILISIFSVFILSLVMPWFLGEKFQSSMQYLPWLVFAALMRGLFHSLLAFISYIKKTKIIMYIVLLLALLDLFFNYILISYNGTIGAAQATFIVFFIGFILLMFIVCQKLTLPWLSFFKGSK